MMGLLYNLVLLSHCVSVALAAPAPTRGTESGGGIAPWAGQGPKPAPRVQSSRPEPFAAAGSSSIPVGSIISSCTVPGTVALTFDDGPYIYTSRILDTLRASNIPATFFVNGDNWSNILNADNQALVKRMVAEGHQVGSHTYVISMLLPTVLYQLDCEEATDSHTAGRTPTSPPSTALASSPR